MAYNDNLPEYFKNAFDAANAIGGCDDEAHFIRIMNDVIAEAIKQRAVCAANAGITLDPYRSLDDVIKETEEKMRERGFYPNGSKIEN